MFVKFKTEDESTVWINSHHVMFVSDHEHLVNKAIIRMGVGALTSICVDEYPEVVVAALSDRGVSNG